MLEIQFRKDELSGREFDLLRTTCEYPMKNLSLAIEFVRLRTTTQIAHEEIARLPVSSILRLFNAAAQAAERATLDSLAAMQRDFNSPDTKFGEVCSQLEGVANEKVSVTLQDSTDDGIFDRANADGLDLEM